MSDVGAWLRGIGFEEYLKSFSDQGIEFDLLSELTDADLEKCGITKLGHRKRLLKAIKGIHVEVDAVGLSQGANSIAPSRPVPAERRHVTVMFCDLVGSTTLSTEYDPEDLRRIVGAYHEAVKRAVAPYEGYIAQLLGDGVMLYFGYPRAHEDEAIRAVRSALEVIKVIEKTDFGIGLKVQARIGIATGLVVIGEVGSGTAAAEAGISGQAPNLAARLQGEAPPMGIVIADETRRQVGEAFQVESLGALKLKGFTHPEHAWRVVGERASFTRFDALRGHGTSQLIGRDQEMAFLLDRWSSARQGIADLAILSAESGLGKSLIMKVLRERVDQDGGTSLILQCSPYHRLSTLYPMVRWLEIRAGVKPDDVGEEVAARVLDSLSATGIELSLGEQQWVSALVSPSTLATDLARLPSDELQRGVQAALATTLVRISRARPLLLVVEDAQWIDAGTEELIVHLTQRLRNTAMLSIVTCRPEFQPTWTVKANVTRLTLSRLGREACERIIGNTARKPMPEVVINEILKKSDGIPSFLEEITRTVLTSGVLIETESGWKVNGPTRDLTVPASLRDSLMNRIDQLTLAREVVQVAAAIGREFEPAVIAHVLGIDSLQLQAALAELDDAALVLHDHDSQTGGYAFRHALVRDVAYDQMLKSLRTKYHGLIARALETLHPDRSNSQPDALAMHYQEARQFERAWPLWKKAGENAARKGYAFEQALEFYEKALVVLRRVRPDVDERALDILLLKEVVLARLGRRAEQALTIDESLRMAERLENPAQTAVVLLRKASARAYSGDIEAARAAGLSALAIYRRIADRHGEAEALTEMGFLHWRAEEYGVALQYARDALVAHRSLGDTSGEATALHNLAEIHRGLGSPRQALEWYGQALQLHWAVGNRDGEILTLFGMANAVHQSGDVSGSRKKYEEALAMSERYGERTMQSRALQALAIHSRIEGAIDDAFNFISRAIEVDRSIHYAHALSHDLVELCAVHLLRNERDFAKTALQEALGWCEFTEDRGAAAAAKRWLAELDAGRTPVLSVVERQGGVKSHLPLPEGKVYCEFESPLASGGRL